MWRPEAFSDGERAAVKCYGANDVLEGVAIMKHEGVDVSITGNSTNPTRFQHLVAGTYKKWAMENGKKYFSVASGGGTGRTLHPDNMAAGPASYGLTDSMGRMHGDAQFAGSSSVPGARGNDGPDRHGQQPDGWRYRRLRCGCVRGNQVISLSDFSDTKRYSPFYKKSSRNVRFREDFSFCNTAKFFLKRKKYMYIL